MTPSNPDTEHRRTGSMADDGNNETTKQKIEEDVQDAKREASAQAQEKAEAGQHKVADETDALSDAIDAAASSLDDHDREGLARYARELSSNLASAAGQLENRSVDELANDAKRLARNNPALFMLGSISVGFGLSRFFKASAERDHQNDEARNADSTRDEDLGAGIPPHQRDPDMADTNAPSNNPTNGHGRELL